MNYWLMKSEPDTFGIDHLAKAPRRTSGWDGVRNFQARNYLREMRVESRGEIQGSDPLVVDEQRNGQDPERVVADPGDGILGGDGRRRERSRAPERPRSGIRAGRGQRRLSHVDGDDRVRVDAGGHFFELARDRRQQLLPACRIARPGFGLMKPHAKKLGADLAGVVEAVGAAVTRFQPGDEVYGTGKGTFAELVAVTEGVSLTPKPANLTFEEAAAVPVAGLTALQALRDKGSVQPGHEVLINGAAGGVGTFTVQIAKSMGAHVTAVCSTKNVDLVSSLGADEVVDYTQEDFTRGVPRYDLMIDVAGSRPWSEVKRVLRPNATVVIVGGPKANRILGPLGHMLGMTAGALIARQRTTFFISKENERSE